MTGSVHDPVYYIYDGNTVIEVERTLFKVHRSALTREKSTFDSMFGLDADPHLSPTTEGDSDENPIRLHGDTADEFRALCFSVYSLPHELSIAATDTTRALQLVHLARISHKYQFTSIESWALEALTSHLRNPSSLLSPSSSSSPTLVQLTELAVLCQYTALVHATVARWKRLLGEGKDMALAMQVAERLDLHTLHGLAYYFIMLKGREFWETQISLTRDQRVRLLSGHYALVDECERLADVQPQLEHSESCEGLTRYGCDTAWLRLWRDLVVSMVPQMPSKMQRAELLGKILLARSILRALVEKEIPSNGMLDGISKSCEMGLLHAVGMRFCEIEDNLMKYFSDVTG